MPFISPFPNAPIDGIDEWEGQRMIELPDEEVPGANEIRTAELPKPSFA